MATTRFYLDDFFTIISMRDLWLFIYQFAGNDLFNLYFEHGLSFSQLKCHNVAGVDTWKDIKTNILNNLPVMRVESMNMIENGQNISLSFKPLIVKQPRRDRRQCIVLVPCQSNDVFDELRNVQNGTNVTKIFDEGHLYMFLHYILVGRRRGVQYGYHKTWSIWHRKQQYRSIRMALRCNGSFGLLTYPGTGRSFERISTGLRAKEIICLKSPSSSSSLTTKKEQWYMHLECELSYERFIWQYHVFMYAI